MEEAREKIGDELEGLVEWKQSRDLKALSGRIVRLRIRIKDGDLYALRFRS